MTAEQFEVLMHVLGFGFGSVFFAILMLIIDRWAS